MYEPPVYIVDNQGADDMNEKHDLDTNKGIYSFLSMHALLLPIIFIIETVNTHCSSILEDDDLVSEG